MGQEYNLVSWMCDDEAAELFERYNTSRSGRLNFDEFTRLVRSEA